VEDIKVVCSCLNITTQDITNAIENGAKSFEKVQAVTNVGTGCGKCIDAVKELVDELLVQ
jgi:bacterioferritin-associated ferredoxin